MEEQKNSKLYQKMFKIQGLNIKKDANNPFFKSKYISMEAVMDKLQPLLIENKLLLKHNLCFQDNFVNGIMVTTVIDLESGEKDETFLPMITGKAQELGSFISYARRYNICMLFNIIAEDEDDDGNLASQNTVNKTVKTLQKQVDDIQKVYHCEICDKEVKYIAAKVFLAKKLPISCKECFQNKEEDKKSFEKVAIEVENEFKK